MRTDKRALRGACGLVVVGLATPVVVSTALAVDPDCATQICDPAGAPPPACEVTGTVSPRIIADGATVDCTGFDLTVKGFGKIQVTDGRFTLKADSLKVIDGGIIEAREVAGGGSIGFDLEISGQADIHGNLVSLGSAISARGGMGSGGNEAVGGTLAIESGCGGVSIAGNLDLRGGEFGGGYDGGSLEVDTKGDLTVATGVLIDTHGVGNGSSGGDVELESGGKITLSTGATIDAHGDSSNPDGEGLAGSVNMLACDIEVASNVTINAAGIEGGRIPQVHGSFMAASSKC